MANEALPRLVVVFRLVVFMGSHRGQSWQLAQGMFLQLHRPTEKRIQQRPQHLFQEKAPAPGGAIHPPRVPSYHSDTMALFLPWQTHFGLQQRGRCLKEAPWET